MKKVLQILICLFLITGCKSSKECIPRDTPLKIMVATDLHLLADTLHDGQETCEKLYQLRDGKLVKYGKEIILALIDTILEEKPDVVILSGDLTFNGEKESHEEIVSLFQRVLDEQIPVLVLPGNHDIRNPYAISYTGSEAYKTKTIEKEDFKKLYQNFGYQKADSKDKDSLSYLYKLSEDVWFMMLDTNLYEKNSGLGIYGISQFKDSTISWMEKCFKQAKKQEATIIPVTHQVLLDNEAIYLGENRIKNHEVLTTLMAEYESYVSLSGHIHTQSITSNEINGKELYEITTESLAVAQNLYGMITIEDNTFHYEARPLNVEKWAQKNQITDENLLNFSNYAWNHYSNVTYIHFKDRFEGYEIDDSVKEMLAQLYAEINPYFFSGSIDEIRDDILNSPAYQQVSQYEEISEYLETMLTERKLNQKELTISLHE